MRTIGSIGECVPGGLYTAGLKMGACTKGSGRGKKMSDISQGPGWWQASDRKWYPPETHPQHEPTLAPPTPSVAMLAAPPLAWQSSGGFIGKDRSPASVLGLSIITLGIYYLVWYYKINDEIRKHDPDIKVSPGWAVAAISIGAILFFIPPLVSSYATAARIRQMQLDDNQSQTISPVVALLLHMFLGIGYPLYIASQLREHWHGHRRAMRPAP